MMMDLTGMTYGRLSVVRRAPKGAGPQVRWECVCICGNATVVNSQDLRAGHTVSCGCARRNSKPSLKHGECKSAEYSVYMLVKRRCLNPNAAQYRWYGARGVTVCDRWLCGDGLMSGFECFLADMGRRPSASHSIDRIDNAIGYEPSNCRWATQTEQCRNRRSNRTVDCGDGAGSLPLVAQCERLGISYRMVVQRLHRGWSDKAALTTPRGNPQAQSVNAGETVPGVTTDEQMQVGRRVG